MVTALAETINQGYDQTNLSFAIRVYAFLHTPQRPESLCSEFDYAKQFDQMS